MMLNHFTLHPLQFQRRILGGGCIRRSAVCQSHLSATAMEFYPSHKIVEEANTRNPAYSPVPDKHSVTCRTVVPLSKNSATPKVGAVPRTPTISTWKLTLLPSITTAISGFISGSPYFEEGDEMITSDLVGNGSSSWRGIHIIRTRPGSIYTLGRRAARPASFRR